MSDFKKGLTIGILIASSVFLLTAQTSLKKSSGQRFADKVRAKEAEEKIIKQQEIQIFTKDTIISTLDLKITNLESIITNKSNQTTLSQELNVELEKALKRQKRRTFIYKVGTGVGAVLALILLAK